VNYTKEKEKETEEDLKKNQSNKRNANYNISLVQYLGWKFETQERKKDRPLVIRTIPIPQSTPNIKIRPLQNNIPIACVQGTLRECLPARRFRATLLLHTTCNRS